MSDSSNTAPIIGQYIIELQNDVNEKVSLRIQDFDATDDIFEELAQNISYTIADLIMLYIGIRLTIDQTEPKPEDRP